jgi:phosphoglycerate dehydrogenase-like enzyme
MSQTSIPETPLRVVCLASTADHVRGALRIPADVIAVQTDAGPDMLEALANADVLVSGTYKADWTARSPRLRLVQGVGAGYDGIALEAVPPGCQVANVYGHDYGIAEYVFMTMAALNRELIQANAGLRDGRWLGGPLRELRNRSVLVVGLGRIGREVVRWAQFIGMRPSAITEHPSDERREAAGLEALGTLDDLAAMARDVDFVVIAVPHSDRTTNLVNEAVLAGMRPTAYLINVGRGPVVDQWALYRALTENRLAGAAIDVWYHYPTGSEDLLPSDAPFWELPNVIMTPHTAGYTEGTMRHRWIAIAENIRRLAVGEPLDNVVWPRPAAR